MSATGWLRARSVELLWVAFAVANVVAMLLTPDWETIPFHFIWVSLTVLYGFRVWGLRATSLVLALVALTTGGVILNDAFEGSQLWGELFEVPLMSAMFVAMVWHARRRQAALGETQRIAAERAELLDQQERLLHDVSHELRTPVTIARGHLEMLQRAGRPLPEVMVAVDELDRISYIIDRLLLLAKARRPDFVAISSIQLTPFLEDVFIRWSDVAPRAWRLGDVPEGALRADPHALRIALDALIENAVDHTGEPDAIELAAVRTADGVEIRVCDEGTGIPADALDRIFDRFARADTARTRRHGGAGLGLAIVDTVARAHEGRCVVSSSPAGSTFSLRLPGFAPAPAPPPASPPWRREPRKRAPRGLAVALAGRRKGTGCPPPIRSGRAARRRVRARPLLSVAVEARGVATTCTCTWATRACGSDASSASRRVARALRAGRRRDGRRAPRITCASTR
jgi:signal transduction histidine kinase